MPFSRPEPSSSRPRWSRPGIRPSAARHRTGRAVTLGRGRGLPCRRRWCRPGAAVIGIHGVAAQLGRSRGGRVGIGGRGGTAQAGFADAARQKFGVAAVVAPPQRWQGAALLTCVMPAGRFDVERSSLPPQVSTARPPRPSAPRGDAVFCRALFVMVSPHFSGDKPTQRAQRSRQARRRPTTPVESSDRQNKQDAQPQQPAVGRQQRRQHRGKPLAASLPRRSKSCR